MRARRRLRSIAVLPAVLVLGTVLAGCSTDVRGEIRGAVEEITLDANARDADGVRRGVDDLLSLLEDAVRSGELSSAEAARIAELATLLRDRADLLDEQEEPSPSPTSASPTPSPTPSPEPEPEPEPEPTEEPEPDEDEEPDEEPTGEPTEDGGILPTIGVGVLGSRG